MTAFYSIQFTVLTSKMSVNTPPLSSKLLFHRNITAPSRPCVLVYTYIHTTFIVLAFVKVQNIDVFIFVKWVFISLALNNAIAKMLICKLLRSYQSHTE